MMKLKHITAYIFMRIALIFVEEMYFWFMYFKSMRPMAESEKNEILKCHLIEL